MPIKPKSLMLAGSYLLLLIITLISFLGYTGYLSNIAAGAPVGYPASAVIWLSSIFSLIAAIFLILMLIFRVKNLSLSDELSKRKSFVAIIVVAAIALFLILQYATNTLVPIERGIVDGFAPPSLLEISSIITLFAVFGLIIFKGEGLVINKNLSSTNGGSIVQPLQTAMDSSASLKSVSQSYEQERKEQTFSSQPSMKPEVPAASSEPKLDDEIFKKVSGIISPDDLTKLTSPQPTISQSEKDALQTRKNIAEWILLSLRIAGKTPKGKLETSFEEQFPKLYVPLFNSVLYDLIYQGKVESTKEGNRMMISLAKSEQK